MNLLETIKNQKTINIINKNEDFNFSNKKNTTIKISENIKNPILIKIINKSECFNVLNKILNTKEIELKASLSSFFKSIVTEDNKKSLVIKETILKEFFKLFGLISGVEITSNGFFIIFSKYGKEIQILLNLNENGYVVDNFIISDNKNGTFDSSTSNFYIDDKKLSFDFSSSQISLKNLKDKSVFSIRSSFFNTDDFYKNTMIFGTTAKGKSGLGDLWRDSHEKELFLNIYKSIKNKKYDILCDFINMDSLVNDGNDSYNFILNNYDKIDFNNINMEDLYV